MQLQEHSYRSAPLTVSDIFNLPDFPKLKLASGENGLKNIINNVSVYEVTDAYKWFRGNEFIITTFLSVPAYQYEEVFEELAKRKIAGIVLCYPELYYGSVPDSLLKLSNNYNIPLFTATKEVAYVDIMLPILHRIIGSDSKLHFRLKIIHEYNQILLNKALFSDIISFIHRYLSLPLLLLDKDYEIIALQTKTDLESNKIMEFVQNNLVSLLNKYAKRLESRQIMIIDYDQLLVTFYPIVSSHSVLGQLIVFGTDKINDEATIVVEQGLETLAIQFMGHYAGAQHYNNIKNEFISFIIKETTTEQELNAFKEKASLLGLDEHDHFRLVLINYQKEAEINNYVLRRRFNIINDSLKQYFSRCIFFEFQEKLLLIIPTSSNSMFESSIQRIAEDISSKFQSLTLIISPNNSELTKFRHSFKLVSKALQIYNLLPNNNSSLVWAEKIEPLIYLADALILDKSLSKWATKVLEPLINYDKEKKLGLLETLTAIILQNDNLKEISNKLFIHTNTLMYRKRIIERLLNNDPFGKGKFYYTLAIYVLLLGNSYSPIDV